MDTLTATEQIAVRALANEPGFALGVFNYAVEFLNRYGEEDRNFQVSNAHLDEFYERLRSQRGMTLDRDTFRVAAPFVRFSLEAEISAQAWGEEGAFGRRLPYDIQLQTAIELLKSASSTGDLFQNISQATH
jgi:hypothetical protein